MRTSRTLFGLIALVLAVGYTNAGAPTSFGGATRTLLLTQSTTAANAGDLVLWFTPATAIPAGGSITFESDTNQAAAVANTACTVKANNGATSIPVSDNAAETKWTSTKILLVTTKTTEIVAGKVVTVTCPKAQLADLGGAAADVKFKVKTSTDTTDTALTHGYQIYAALTVGGAAKDIAPTVTRAANYKTGQAGGDLIITFTPTKTTVANAAIKITTSAAVWSADGTAGSCTVHQLNYETGVMTAVSTTGVESSTVSGGAGKINTIATAAALTAGLPVKVVCDGTKNMATNVAGENKFRLETAADTTKTADTAAGCTLTLSHANHVGTAVTWTSATRTSYVTGTAAATAGDLVVTFTPTTDLATNDVITLTASEEIFAAAGQITGITATGNSGATALTITEGADTKTVETAASVPLATAKMKNHVEVKMGGAATPHPIVLTIPHAKLAANGATAQAVTFSISTSKDKGTLFAQTGYTLTAPVASSSAAAAGNSTASASAAAATGTETTVTQVYTFASLTVAQYTGDMKSNCECAYANTVEAATTPTWCVATTSAYTYKSGVVMSSSAAARRAAKVTFILKVKSSVKSSTQIQTMVAANSNAANFASALTAVNTASNKTVAPGAATVAAATFTGSSASTLLPSMLSLVAAIFVAARQ